MGENFDIKYQDHYKLYVLLKDKILFEDELEKRGIKFYCDLNEQPFIDSGIRYFFLDSDMKLVDQIIKENEIVANTESYLISDYRDEKKILKKYFMVVLIVAIIMILIVMFDKIF